MCFSYESYPFATILGQCKDRDIRIPRRGIQISVSSGRWEQPGICTSTIQSVPLRVLSAEPGGKPVWGKRGVLWLKSGSH